MANAFENTHEERRIIAKKKICGYDLVNTTTEKEFGEANTIGQQPDKAITADAAHLVAYTCDLDFGVNNEHPESYEGVVYYFDHWVICTPSIISQPCTDIREDWVQVTYLLEYREDMQVLMRKKDLKQIGFRLYLTERIKNTINFLNRSNFPASHNLEDIKAYRDIATILSFIYTYDIDLFGLGSKDDYMLIWSTDNDDKVYQFELVRLPAKVEQIPSKEWLNNLRQTGVEEEIKPETSHPSTENVKKGLNILGMDLKDNESESSNPLKEESFSKAMKEILSFNDFEIRENPFINMSNNSDEAFLHIRVYAFYLEYIFNHNSLDENDMYSFKEAVTYLHNKYAAIMKNVNTSDDKDADETYKIICLLDDAVYDYSYKDIVSSSATYFIAKLHALLSLSYRADITHILANNCVQCLNVLIKMRNKDVEDGCPIDSLTKTHHAIIMNRLVTWMTNNMSVIKEYKEMTSFEIKIKDDYHMELVIDMH